MTDKVEILAPCGSYESLVAAVNAGADAVYLSGKSFGARAYALNFSDEDILDAITYAHRNNVKVYLTVNTLLKNNEIERVTEYLLPFYRNGLDAVIVQDFGVFSAVKRTFPDIDIHCSTQMNICSFHGARYMKELGAKRIVTAREMSLSEIKEIHDKVDVEIETFVHGALCFCYSGRCLMSQAVGERSGNRGRCAQPCRKAYNGTYNMSMKDLCSVTEIPEIIESGIYSLKIEGRMKNEIYTAATTSAYRELCDDYYSGRFSMDKAVKMKDRLAEIFNRGGFTEGYFHMNNGNKMITFDKPGNCGVAVGKVTEISGGKVSVRLSKAVNKGDSFELMLKDGSSISLTAPGDGKEGTLYSLNAPKTKLIKAGTSLFRMKNDKVTRETEDIVKSIKRNPVTVKGTFETGEPIYLSANTKVFDRIVEYSVTGDVVSEAMKAPVGRNQIEDKLKKLGDMPFSIEKLSLSISDNAYFNMSAFNNLRRDLFNGLLCKIDEEFSRQNINNYEYKLNNNLILKDYNDSDSLSIMVSDKERLRVVEELSKNVKLKRVYISYQLLDGDIDKTIAGLKASGAKVILKLPEIIRSKYESKINNIIKATDKFDGIYLSSTDSLYTLDECDMSDKTVVISSSIYAYNNYSIDFIYNLLKNKAGKVVFTMPEELSSDELSLLRYPDDAEVEIIGYGRQRLMITAQCIRSQTAGCTKNSGYYQFTDELSNSFLGATNCEMCYNVIYNSVPTSLHQYKAGLPSIRLDIVDEDKELIIKLVSMFSDRTKDFGKPDYKYTTGKYKRGIL